MLSLVLAGHLIGDWVVQTDRQARDKTTSWRAMGRHMLGYHVTLALFSGIAWPFHRGLPVDWWAFLGVSLATHAFIDRRWPVVRLMACTGSERFSESPWGVLVVDQVLHISILCILVAAFS